MVMDDFESSPESQRRPDKRGQRGQPWAPHAMSWPPAQWASPTSRSNQLGSSSISTTGSSAYINPVALGLENWNDSGYVTRTAQQTFPLPPAVTDDIPTSCPQPNYYLHYGQNYSQITIPPSVPVVPVNSYMSSHFPMPTPPSNPFPRDTVADMAPGKRRRDINSGTHLETSGAQQPPRKRIASVAPARHERSSHSFSGNSSTAATAFGIIQGYGSHQPDRQRAPQPAPRDLSKEQESFIRSWYITFATKRGFSFFAAEDVDAFATLLGTHSQVVWNYLNKITGSPAENSQHGFNATGTSLPSDRQQAPLPNAGYSLKQTNRHLPHDVLQLVERYVSGCQRRRPRNDGRRSVNQGPYQCTFGCGYRTKRVYDWTRHEETHQPQRLWLCQICRQSGEHNPFLVNRPDKFLKHAKVAHMNQDPDRVLDISKLDFRADFDPQCHICSEVYTTWDDKYKHIQQHYDDAVYDEKHGGKDASWKRALPEQHGGSNSSSESSDSSEDEDGPDYPQDKANRRDGTGGSGGSSGNMSGFGVPKHGSRGNAPWPSGGEGNQQTYYGGVGYTASAEHSSPSSGCYGLLPDSKPPNKTILVRAPSSLLAKAVWGEKPSTAMASMRQFGQNHLPDFGRPLVLSRAHIPKPQRPFATNPVPALTFLGHGAHGIVDTVQQYVTGKVYARKRSRNATFSEEVEIMKRMNHPHIVKYVAAYMQDASLNLIMSPVAELTLSNYLAASGHTEHEVARIHRFLNCLSSGVSYIHSKRVRHGDLKPQNILIHGADVLISDFGISRVVSDPSTSSSDCPSTPFYAPMEIAAHLRHGRSADVFSLGCVFLELLTVAGGSSVTELHRRLGFTRTRKRARDGPAYWKVQNELLSWIKMMKFSASEPIQRLWDLCSSMLRNKPDGRPSSYELVDLVRQALSTENMELCEVCKVELADFPSIALEPNMLIEADATGFSPVPRPPTPFHRRDRERVSVQDGTAVDLLPGHVPGRIVELEDSDNSAPESCSTAITTPTVVTPRNCSCSCTSRKARISLYEFAEILKEHEQSAQSPQSLSRSGTLEFTIPLHFPPAYTEAHHSPIVVSILHDAAQPFRPVYSLMQHEDTDGKGGRAFLLESVSQDQRCVRAFPPRRRTSRTLSQRACHRCGTRFVAPRLLECRNCSHTLCERCVAPLGPSSSPVIRSQAEPRKAEPDLAAIGSHLLPPAYSLGDYQPAHLQPHIPLGGVDGVESEGVVLDLVIAQTESHGKHPVQRFILGSPSTFDRIRSPVDNYSNEWFSPPPENNSPLEDPPKEQHFDLDRLNPPEGPSSKRAKYSHQAHAKQALRAPTARRISDRAGRQYISGRSKQSVAIKKPQPSAMKATTTTPGALELSQFSRPKTNAHTDTSYSPHGDTLGDTTVPGGPPTFSAPGMVRSKSQDSSTASSPASMFSEDSMAPPLHALPMRKTLSAPSHGARHGVEAASAGHGPRLSSSLPRHTYPLPAGSPCHIGQHERPDSSSSPRATRHHYQSGSGSPTFQYYGRHANSWLFNDISVRAGVKRGFHRIFHGNANGNGRAEGAE